MVLFKSSCLLFAMLSITIAVQFPTNPTSEMSADDKNLIRENKTTDVSDESGYEIEREQDDLNDKKFLDDALKTVLDPTTIISTFHEKDQVEMFRSQLEEIAKDNLTLNTFMEEMDNLSLEVCKTSQDALWSYVTNFSHEGKRNEMIRITAEEDEIKKQYWNILKTKYINNEQLLSNPKLRRKLRIIKERGTNVQMPQSRQREEIDTMQRIWSRATLCAYNVTSCNMEGSVRTMSDVISIFKTSNNTKELVYYWKAYHDATGKKVRPIFKDYVQRMNNVARSENFTDAGDMWRYSFEDDNFAETVDKLWKEIKPMYVLLHEYVRNKLKTFYNQDLMSNDNMIPAHLLGNLWAQDWQAIFPKVAAYKDFIRPCLSDNESIDSKDLFDTVDAFYQSIGFETANDTYQDIAETMSTANCLPSSHDMCDGVRYKIKWCGEKVTDVAVGLSRAARLLGHVQYFKHYRHLPQLYRDGPTPSFHDAISDIVAIQLMIPAHLKSLNLVKINTSPEITINHLLWLALEKLPLMAYAYVLDKWRWDVFANATMDNWNQHWWDLRQQETRVSPPVPRNESDLDPAAKYHVVSHVQYITYLISHILEFQILLSLCKAKNHTGPLHECSIYGAKEAGKLLSNGMSLGASEDWRTVLKAITGETELSSKGIREYFQVLEEYLRKENEAAANLAIKDMDQSVPIIVGVIVVILTIFIIVLYCVKKYNVGSHVFSICGKNGSLDIATNNAPQAKANEVIGISEDKV